MLLRHARLAGAHMHMPNFTFYTSHPPGGVRAKGHPAVRHGRPPVAHRPPGAPAPCQRPPSTHPHQPCRSPAASFPGPHLSWRRVPTTSPLRHVSACPCDGATEVRGVGSPVNTLSTCFYALLPTLQLLTCHSQLPLWSGVILVSSRCKRGRNRHSPPRPLSPLRHGGPVTAVTARSPITAATATAPTATTHNNNKPSVAGRRQ